MASKHAGDLIRADVSASVSGMEIQEGLLFYFFYSLCIPTTVFPPSLLPVPSHFTPHSPPTLLRKGKVSRGESTKSDGISMLFSEGKIPHRGP